MPGCTAISAVLIRPPDPVCGHESEDCVALPVGHRKCRVRRYSPLPPVTPPGPAPATLPAGDETNGVPAQSASPPPGAPSLSAHRVPGEPRQANRVLFAPLPTGKNRRNVQVTGHRPDWAPANNDPCHAALRSEERRVGKECRSRRSPYHERKKR